MLTYTFVIPSSKQKHTTGSLTATHTHDQQQLQTKSNRAHHISCKWSIHWLRCSFYGKIPSASSNKKDIILLTMDWLWGHLQALLQCRNVSNICLGLANGTKLTPSQKWGNLLCELHVPHRQCLASISNAFSASFTSIWPSFP